jgi:hypothetical protein
MDSFYQNSNYEVADIFHMYGDEYCRKHPMPASYFKVIHDIKVCRTEYLGGHIFKCDLCGFETIVHNSCRNRHCPKCQFTARLKWVQDRKSEILPVGYFHIIFTLPHELNPIVLCNKKVCLNLLFKSVSETLLKFGKGELKGQIGFIAILHTWSQTLIDHYHVHCIIPAGAISENKQRWHYSRKNFIFSSKAMSLIFRGKYIDYLKKSYDNGELVFPTNNITLSVKKFINELWKKKWVVYSKKPFSDPTKVLEYLSRYTHRVAITNHRLVSIGNGIVRFKYKDRKNGNVEKEMTLTAEEFIRRFLLHILPEQFMKIRYYGFLGNRNRKENVLLCRELIGIDYIEFTEGNTFNFSLECIGLDVTKCPHCKKGQMKIMDKILSYTEKIIYNNTS